MTRPEAPETHAGRQALALAYLAMEVDNFRRAIRWARAWPPGLSFDEARKVAGDPNGYSADPLDPDERTFAIETEAVHGDWSEALNSIARIAWRYGISDQLPEDLRTVLSGVRAWRNES